MDKKYQHRLEGYLRDLCLTSVCSHYQEFSEQARAESQEYERYLFNVMQQEWETRRGRRIERHLKHSGLPLEKNWAAFDLKRLPAKVVQQVRILQNGEFIRHQENLLVFGNPGSGKTHLVCALAQELIHQDHKIAFFTCAMLLQELLSAKKNLTLPRLIKKLSRYDAVIIDDIGYVQQDKQEMEVLFTFLAERYERGSVIVTSNLPFSQWEKIFKDPMMTAAAVDRIVHHSTILELNIESYRITSAKKRKERK
jgi:DNA replication protein DnaC